MRYHIAVLKWAFKIVISYKWHYIINLLINPIALFIFISLFRTIYAYDANQFIAGYTCTQMIWYYAATTFFYCFVWCEPDKEISEDIISGSLAVKLIRPITIMKAFFVNALAFRVNNFLFSFIPTFVIYMMFVYPDFLSLTALIKYLIINFFAFILFYLFSFIIGTMAFRLQSITTLRTLKIALVMSAGVFIPLEFLPKIFQSLIKALPFQYFYYVPVQFFLNKPETQNMAYFTSTILSIVIWIAVFYLLSILSWRSAIKRFYSVGG